MTDQLTVTDAGFGFGWAAEPTDTWSYNGVDATAINHTALKTSSSTPISGDAGTAQSIWSDIIFYGGTILVPPQTFPQSSSSGFIFDFANYYTLPNIVSFTVIETSIIAEHLITGKEGGNIQYLGSNPKSFVFTLSNLGAATAVRALLERLRIVPPNHIKIVAHGQTWIDADVKTQIYVAAYTPGIPNATNASGLIVLTLMEKT